MDVRLLEYMLVLERLGSVSAAAEEIHISQSALSQSLARLEKSLHTQLFVRANRKLTPTPAGKVYLDGARQMLAVKRETYEKLENLIRMERNQVRIAICDQVYAVSGAGILAEMKRRFPSVHFQFLPVDSGVIPEYLDSELVDFAVFCENGPPAATLCCRPLFRERLALAVPESAAWEGREIDRKALLSNAFIYPERGTFLYRLVRQALKGQGLIFGDVYNAGNVSEIKMLAGHGYGAALLPERAAALLEECRIYSWKPEVSYNVVYAVPVSQKDSSLAGMFYETLRQCLESRERLERTEK